MTQADDFAFPAPIRSDEDGGLTVREFFAALALQGLLANPTAESLGVGRLASNAVALADALIVALNAKE